MSYCIPERVSRKGSLQQPSTNSPSPRLAEASKSTTRRSGTSATEGGRSRIASLSTSQSLPESLNIGSAGQKGKVLNQVIETDTEAPSNHRLTAGTPNALFWLRRAIKLTKESKPKTNSITKFEPRPLKEKWIPSPWE